MRAPYKEDRILRSFQGTKVCYVKNNPLKSRDFRGLLWRRRWDSNPRYREVQLISSHFERWFDENLCVPLVTLKIALHSHSPRCTKRRKCVEVPLLTGDSISEKALNIKAFWNCKSGCSTRFRIVWTRCFRDNIGAYRKVKSLISQRFQGIQYVGLEPVKAWTSRKV